MEYTKGKKDKKGLEYNKYIQYQSKQRVTSKLIWTIDNFGIGEGFKMH